MVLIPSFPGVYGKIINNFWMKNIWVTTKNGFEKIYIWKIFRRFPKIFYAMTNIFCGSKYFVQLTKDTRNEGISTVRINPINLNRQLSKTKKLERFKNLQPLRKKPTNQDDIALYGDHMMWASELTLFLVWVFIILTILTYRNWCVFEV